MGQVPRRGVRDWEHGKRRALIQSGESAWRIYSVPRTSGRVPQKITLAIDTQNDGPELTGVFISVEVFNASGALIATNCATAVGQRLVP